MEHYKDACHSFGVNHYLLWGAGIPLEGLVLGSASGEAQADAGS